MTSISIGPAAAVLPKGSSSQLVATGIYSDGTRRELLAMVTWSTANASVASVSNTAATAGLLTAVDLGQTSITATYADVSGTTSVTVTDAALVAIDLTPAGINLPAGSVSQLTVTATYTDHSTQNLTASARWTSSNVAVASVGNGSTAGLASLVGVGSATITATLSGLSAATTVSVTAAVLASIEVTPTTAAVAAGLTQQFMATGVYSDGSSHDLTSLVTWTSSATANATLSNASGSEGLATTISPGVMAVNAAYGGKTGGTSFTVSAATLVAISVSPPSPSLAQGLQLQFTATGIFTDHSIHALGSSAVWSSSATAVAAISNAAGSNGVATASSEGSATITATLGSISAGATLSVTAAALVSIGVTPAARSIAIGTDQQFIATGTYSDNSSAALTTAVTWTSSAPAVAAISNAAGTNGLASARAAGTTTISASVSGISGSTVFTVSTTRLVSIAVTPASPSIGVGTQQHFTATGTFSDQSTQNLTSAATWASANTGVAVVQNTPGFNGLALGQGAGSTVVTASLNSISGSTPLTVVRAALLAIVVTPANSSIANGTDEQLAATGHYSDGSTQDLTSSVTWTPSLPSIASISNASGTVGIATALSLGSTTISAALGGISGVTRLTVAAATLVSLAVTPPNPTLANDFSQWFVATGTYTDASTQNLTSAVSWSSSAPSVASISNAAGSHGLATAVNLGATLIGAAVGTISAPAVTLTVIAAQETAYVANNGYGTVSQYTVGSGGALSAMNPATVAAGNYPASIALDPSYRYAYVANNDGSISEYLIGAGGALTPMTVASVAAGNYPQSIVVDPTGRFVYVVNNGDATVSQFEIVAGGALAPMNPATFSIGGLPEAVAIDPSGRYVYVANANGTVAEYTVGSSGALVAQNPASVTAGAQPQALAVDPSGRYVYVANGGDNTISQFSIGSGGALAAMNPASVATGDAPTSVAVDPSGRTVYAAASSDGTVWQYAISADGGLSVINAGNSQAGGDPQFLSVDVSGKFLYAADANDIVAQFILGAGGTLPAASAATTSTGGPQALATGY